MESRLFAILAKDVVGNACLLWADEKCTIPALKRACL
jgi:hypothetical protein